MSAMRSNAGPSGLGLTGPNLASDGVMLKRRCERNNIGISGGSGARGRPDSVEAPEGRLCHAIC